MHYCRSMLIRAKFTQEWRLTNTNDKSPHFHAICCTQIEPRRNRTRQMTPYIIHIVWNIVIINAIQGPSNESCRFTMQCGYASSLPCLLQNDFILSRASSRPVGSVAKAMRIQSPFIPSALPAKKCTCMYLKVEYGIWRYQNSYTDSQNYLVCLCEFLAACSCTESMQTSN